MTTPPATTPPATRAARLAAIRECEQAAIPGPWEYFKGPEDGDAGSVEGGLYWICGIAPESDGIDAQFIANARQDVPWLLAEVERLSAALLLIKVRIPMQLSRGSQADWLNEHIDAALTPDEPPS